MDFRSDVLRTQLQEQGISIAELVRRTKLSRTLIKSLTDDSTASNPTIQTVGRVAEALNISPLDLIRID